MTALSDALTAAQRSALAALEKAYVAGALESEAMVAALEVGRDQRPGGYRVSAWSCEPTCKGDFRNMPFEDDSFQLVVFDPPHVTREKQPPEGINGLKYGALHPETEQEDLRRGFAECWRVLRPGGTLVFKWGAGSIKRVEPHFPAVPIVGTRSPRGGQTRWFIFYKPLVAAELEAVA